MADEQRWENIGGLIAELFDPHMDVPGTAIRRKELQRLAKRLRNSIGKPDMAPIQRQVLKQMEKLTATQITAVANAKPSMPTQGDVC